MVRRIRATASQSTTTTRATTAHGPNDKKTRAAPTRTSAIAGARAPSFSASLAQRIRPEGLPGRGIGFAGEAFRAVKPNGYRAKGFPPIVDTVVTTKVPKHSRECSFGYNQS
jgi:hypothetical protein